MNPDAAKPPTCLIQNQPGLHPLCFATDQKNAGFPVPVRKSIFFWDVDPVSRLLGTYRYIYVTSEI